MSDNPPDWAIERAEALVSAAIPPNGGVHFNEVQRLAFARYIAEHEEPPVDPLLIEARNLCCKRYSGDDHVQKNLRAGKYDHHSDVLLAQAALRRGIEIERERQS